MYGLGFAASTKYSSIVYEEALVKTILPTRLRTISNSISLDHFGVFDSIFGFKLT